MSTLQDLVYNLEEGRLRRFLVIVAMTLLTIGLLAWIGISEFNGLRTQEAMDLAQQARQIASGQGLTTQLIRPLALWQVRAQFGSDAPGVSSFPETLSPPLYPVLLGGLFKLGQISGKIPMSVAPELVRGMRVYPPDYIVLALNLACVALAVLAVYLWGSGQFDFGVGILSAVFFLGSTALWNQVISGGAVCLVVSLYAWAGYFFYRGLAGEEDCEDLSDRGGFWFGIAGFTLGLAPLVQMIQIWPVLALLGCGIALFKRGRIWLFFGTTIPVILFFTWLGWLWVKTRNPIGLNWAYLISDSAHYPGNLVWRTYNFDIEKTNVWNRIFGSALRGTSFLISQGPISCGATLAGTLALFSILHGFRRVSAATGKFLWLGGVVALVIATTFIVRDVGVGSCPPLLVLLPLESVYGAAGLFVLVERWNLEVDLLKKIFLVAFGVVATGPLVCQVVRSDTAPFAYPPTYPPIFLFMRSWFEPKELQASDLPAAEAWYSNQPTLWVPATRDELIKIHDRVTPIFSILFTPASSDVKMYSQMLQENSEWSEWVDVIRRQKPPDLPQSFVTSLPPNNDYLLLSIQKRWN